MEMGCRRTPRPMMTGQGPRSAGHGAACSAVFKVRREQKPGDYRTRAGSTASTGTPGPEVGGAPPDPRGAAVVPQQGVEAKGRRKPGSPSWFALIAAALRCVVAAAAAVRRRVGHGDAGYARHAGLVVKEQKSGVSPPRSRRRHRGRHERRHALHAGTHRSARRRDGPPSYSGNRGQTLHEFVLGTAVSEEHAELTMKFPEHGTRRALHAR